MVRLELSLEEACALYDAFHYYGKCNTIEAAEEMMVSEEPVPLINHWSDFDEFLSVWDLFYRLSRTCPRSLFGKCVVVCQLPQDFAVSKMQIDLLSNPNEFKTQACFLLSFFDSMSDYFEYEVEMIERGYPHRHRAAS